MSLTRAEFSRLVADHGATLYRVAFRLIGNAHAAEDVVQETFRSAWTSRERFVAVESTPPEIHDADEQTIELSEAPTIDLPRGTLGSERAWLIAILRRRVADRWRRHDRLVTSESTEIAFEPPDPIESGYTDEMQHALERVPTDLRECLLLVVVGELTHQEVAELLGLPLGTVLSRVSRARARLREFFLALRKS